MGTEVLYSQDLLAQRLHIAPPHFHNRRNFPSQENFSNLVVNRCSCHNNNGKTSPQSDKRKSNETKGATYGSDARQKEGGGVRILRRGQSLSCIAAKLNGGDGSAARSVSPPAADDMTVGRMRPERMPNQIRQSPLPLPLLDVYAGSAFSLSPSPRSLPLPSFFNKKINPSDDPATRDLRRLLRLD
ncbi:hypothetical protein SASPL_109205 [Salvia splendens]|uniref:Uncharacterized protein n=1 Tax=Salvia splendens TaxID=180675 RepID=A0A8X8YDS3_SALSN|nr:hypothetical protein SASPL_109205 [Salvia splendens]